MDANNERRSTPIQSRQLCQSPYPPSQNSFVTSILPCFLISGPTLASLDTPLCTGRPIMVCWISASCYERRVLMLSCRGSRGWKDWLFRIFEDTINVEFFGFAMDLQFCQLSHELVVGIASSFGSSPFSILHASKM